MTKLFFYYELPHNQFISTMSLTEIITNPKLYLFLILVFFTIIRAYNLDYNSPFKDEAVYIVVGKLHTFQKDFWSYNANAWMGGSPFFYPPMSALAYISGGIVGSRLLNVFFGILSIDVIFHLTVLLTRPKNKYKLLSGFIAAIVLGGATTAIYLSRLATYDMPSFYFLILSLYLLVLAEQKGENIGKWYFLAAVFLLLSFLIKIIVVLFLPAITFYTFFKAKSVSKRQLFFWRSYFLIPIVLGLAAYLLTTHNSLVAFFGLQFGREKVSYLEVIKTFWSSSSWVWLMWALGSIGLLLTKQWRKWALLSSTSLIILAAHIFTNRSISLDKHSFLSIIFLSLVAGLGISEIIFFLAKKLPSSLFASLGVLTSIFLVYLSFSFKAAAQFNDSWPNSNQVLSVLNQKVKSEDRILAQSGADVILSLYNRNFPTNTSTFDYFVYQKLTGLPAYTQATNDGYFNYIELYQDPNPNDTDAILSKQVQSNLADNYQLIYKQNGYLLYERNY